MAVAKIIFNSKYSVFNFLNLIFPSKIPNKSVNNTKKGCKTTKKSNKPPYPILYPNITGLAKDMKKIIVKKIVPPTPK